MEEIEPFYFTIVDAFEFKEAALPALNEVASGTVEMKVNYCDLVCANTRCIHVCDIFLYI